MGREEQAPRTHFNCSKSALYLHYILARFHVGKIQVLKIYRQALLWATLARSLPVHDKLVAVTHCVLMASCLPRRRELRWVSPWCREAGLRFWKAP